MPIKRKANLSKKSKQSRSVKEANSSQSEEKYNKQLQLQRIRKEKFKQKQSSEQKSKELKGQRNCNKLNRSRILREHKEKVEKVHSQVGSRTRGALKFHLEFIGG